MKLFNHPITKAFAGLIIAPFAALKVLIVSIIDTIKAKKATKEPKKKKSLFSRLVTCLVIFFCVAGVYAVFSPIFKTAPVAASKEKSPLNNWAEFSEEIPQKEDENESFTEEKYDNNGLVVSVSSGVSFSIIQNGEEVSCRLIGIEAPSPIFEEEFNFSKEKLESLILGEKIKIAFVGTSDSDGYAFVNVTLNGDSLQRTLLFAGSVRIDRSCSDKSSLKILEPVEARVSALKQGLWANGWPTEETTSAE